jgi:hypothetical protein
MAVLAVVGFRAWWGWEAGRRMSTVIADIREKGEPATIEDLLAIEGDVPPERNAVTHYRKAFEVARATSAQRTFSPSQSQLNYNSYPPFPPAWHRLNDAAVAANQPIFAHVREARRFDEVDWDKHIPSPMIDILLPELNEARSIANIVGDAALREHLRGNDAAAIEMLRDLRHLSKAVDHQPVVVSHLVSVGIEALVMDRLQVMAGGMAIEPKPADAGDTPTTAPAVRDPVPDGPATHAQLRALIDEILDERAMDDGIRRALLGERVSRLDALNWTGQRSWALRPLFELEAVRSVENAEPGLRAAAVAADWAKVNAELRAAPIPPPRGVSGWFTSGMADGFDPRRVFVQQNRIRMDRRLTAVVLACQLYRVDHNGAWPVSLDALVPAYLPAVPIDPFDPAGKALRYMLIAGGRPRGDDRPVVYSVADDGTDDTASTMPVSPPPFPMHGWVDGTRFKVSTPDQWRDAARWENAPVPPWEMVAPMSDTARIAGPVPDASTQAVEGDGDEAGAPGDEQGEQAELNGEI